MDQDSFLTKNVFKDLESYNYDLPETAQLLTENDFDVVLQRAEYFGIAIYDIATTLDGAPFERVHHEAVNKKSTDPKWYKRAFLTLKKKQTGLLYTATYKVSARLLAR